MFRTIALAAALGAMALPAFATTQVTVHIGGLDAKATHAVIYHAAQAACRAELADEIELVRRAEWAGCVRDAIAGAESRLATMGGLATR
jgi:hypothetical protein